MSFASDRASSTEMGNNSVPAANSSNAAVRPLVSVLTAGYDRPYALGLADTLIALRIPFDFVGSDFVDSPHLHQNSLVRFFNLRGDQRTNASLISKMSRVLAYYWRLILYAATSKTQIFHILWNNKFELFDRTFLTLYYKLLGKRLVFTVHNVNKLKRDGKDTWLNRFTLGIQYRIMDHLFVHTESMKRELLSDFRVSEKKISVIPFGINSTVPDTALTTEMARQKLGLAVGEKTLLFFGNIAPYKGLEYLIEAILLLAKSDQRYRVVIAGRPKGSESYWATIQSRIKDTDLTDRVTEKIEYIADEDTEYYFKAADVFVLPYTHIFQSGVLFLGYNFGLPVIATEVGSLRDDIIEGETGFMCRPQDPRSLAACIEGYFRSELFFHLSENRQKIRAYANERYSWAKVGSITQHVYQRLAAKTR